MKACLLGPYQGNRHLSIDNYLKYSQCSLTNALPAWKVEALRPGAFRDQYFAHAPTTRVQAWRDCYLAFPLKLRRLESDLFHIVDQGLAWYRLFLKPSKVIVTVHDLINLLTMRGKLPLQTVPAGLRLITELSCRQIQKADAVICVSSNTASNVASELEVDPRRIHIIHNSVPKVFRPLPSSERAALRQALFPGVEHVVLHVGKPSPYKNRLAVLRSFELIHQQLPGAKLVLTSQALTRQESAFLAGRPSASAIDIRRPELQQELAGLYAVSDVLIFPSIFEGFGWPPLEAMACGCPVVSSTGGSLAEVVGNAGRCLSDPHDAEAFASAALDILLDAETARQFSQLGLNQALKFSPSKASAQLADLYRSVCSN